MTLIIDNNLIDNTFSEFKFRISDNDNGVISVHDASVLDDNGNQLKSVRCGVTGAGVEPENGA